MFSVPDFLDRAKSAAGIESDYALGKLTGLGKANISSYRLEKSAPDERAILKLCALTGDDPAEIASLIQWSRASNDDAASLWRRVAEQVKKAGNFVIAFTLVAMVLEAMGTSPASASALSFSSADHCLYIMSNGLLIVSTCRAALLLVALFRAGQSREQGGCNGLVTTVR